MNKNGHNHNIKCSDDDDDDELHPDEKTQNSLRSLVTQLQSHRA